MNEEKSSKNWAHGLVGRGRQAAGRDIIRTSNIIFPY